MSPAEQAISDALLEPVRISLENVPLEDLLASIEQTHGIEVQIDRTALTDAGVDDRAPVTIDVAGIGLRSALGVLLDPLDLSWTIRNDVLLITTEQAAEEMLDTRIYDVRDLVSDGVTPDTESDYESLIWVITSTIAPSSWDEVGGPGCVQAYDSNGIQVLIVLQTNEGHEGIAGLLADLRSLRAPRARAHARPAANHSQDKRFEPRSARKRQRVYIAAPDWMVPRVHE
ncbi:MAG: hypothetical protein WD403_15825 [Pirellulales bacterium]